ncbi:asparagine synthase (glutamine-hydrolyzing) [Endozoicomonas numazuensis]|uniref:asparagine synthase (glutamine-hydrolyzing) n=1 Tax=Endozoicomonas numazuensis TaxID=1137799 RepID=A0A081N3Q9_9GAMM|nr:asparagine synthase (glutamine-hydrolyzing) [Endozoicomonas numazuensis]KEQ13082.1 hypothetical protein GZ78_26360 [Endozoicomonas numazuensis]
MCGIVGYFSSEHLSDSQWKQACALQKHRGPDAQGEAKSSRGLWCYGLGHQRLSILDLSGAGSQPMHHADTGALLIYNGEIYNYLELKAELEKIEGVSFSGGSDTEVVLAALVHWGVEEATRRFNGMWAFAYYSPTDDCVYLSRDRTGEKPLYFYFSDKELHFSSELKTLLLMTGKNFSLNMQAVGEYLSQSLLNTTCHTFFSDIEQVQPATIVSIDLSGEALKKDVSLYWDIHNISDVPVSEDEFIDQIRSTFLDSVEKRLRSDVPVGVLLSGGLDSSAIAAAVDKINGKNGHCRLLAAVSDDPRFDESPFIDKVAVHLNRSVEKVELPLSSDTLFSLLEEATFHSDSPIGSFSNIAHYLLMKKAKELGLTVVLSGQGADELLCGYRKFLGFYVQDLLRSKRYFKACKVLWDFWRNGAILNQFSWAEAKRYLPSIFQRGRRNILGPALKEYLPVNLGLKRGESLSSRQILDVERFSVPTLNHFEDKMSMAWSREIRLPFLDHRLMEQLLSAPSELKIKKGWTKYAMRKAVEPYLPSEITWRKDKQGFVNPQGEWLKKDLKKTVLDQYFHRDALIFKLDLINREQLLAHYNEYCSQSHGRETIWFKEIFNPLAMEVWLQMNRKYIKGL